MRIGRSVATVVATHSNLISTAHGKYYVVKAADQTVNNSDTHVNDDELKFPVLATQLWEILFLLLIDSGTTPDIQFSLAVPSNCTGSWKRDNAAQTGDDLSAEKTIVGSGAGTPVYAVIRCLIQVGDTAGNIQLKWAQDVTDASDTKVLADSCLIARLIE